MSIALQAPPDVREDLASVQRQLEGLRFASRAAEERLTWRLQQALALLYMRAGGASQAGPMLAEALERAGLDPGTSSWLDGEVARLKNAIKAAQDEEDWIAEFFYKQVRALSVTFRVLSQAGARLHLVLPFFSAECFHKLVHGCAFVCVFQLPCKQVRASLLSSVLFWGRGALLQAGDFWLPSFYFCLVSSFFFFLLLPASFARAACFWMPAGCRCFVVVWHGTLSAALGGGQPGGGVEHRASKGILGQPGGHPSNFSTYPR